MTFHEMMQKCPILKWHCPSLEFFRRIHFIGGKFKKKNSFSVKFTKKKCIFWGLAKMQTPPRGVHKEQETGESLFKKMRTEKRTQQQRQSSGLPHYGAIHKTRGKIFGIFDFPFVDIFIKYGLCCKIFVRLNPLKCPRGLWMPHYDVGGGKVSPCPYSSPL